MKKWAVLILACELALGGCGSGTKTSVQNAAAVTTGLWEAVLTGGSGVASGPVLSFITDFTVNGDGTLSITEFSFNTVVVAPDIPCFSAEAESGTSSLTTTTNNMVEGSISYVVTSSAPSGNVLTLSGSEVGSTITGTWQLTGSQSSQSTANCNGSGSFTMTKSS